MNTKNKLNGSWMLWLGSIPPNRFHRYGSAAHMVLRFWLWDFIDYQNAKRVPAPKRTHNCGARCTHRHAVEQRVLRESLA